MSLDSEQAYNRFCTQLTSALADHLGIPLRAVEQAVDAATADWSVEHQRMRPVTDPHDRFVITTPWTAASQPNPS